MGLLSDNPILARLSNRIDHYANHFTELGHSLKNDIVGKVNHYGVQSEHQYAHLQQSITDQYGLLNTRVSDLEARLDHARQADAESFRRLAEAQVEGMQQVDEANRRLLQLLERVRMPVVDRLADVDAETAVALNHAAAADGPLREAGLFMNGPLTVLWHPHEARLEAVNERIVEVPFVHGVLADLPAGARILDIGGGESTVGLSLASRGFLVDLVEPGGYPVAHPNLTVHEVGVETLTELEPPDAVVLLSTIEHLGVGAYALDSAPDLDLDAMRHVWRSSRTGTRLVVTTPYGQAGEDALQRTYDRARLTELLRGWRVTEARSALQVDALTWTEQDGLVDEPRNRGVALVVAERTDDPEADPWA